MKVSDGSFVEVDGIIGNEVLDATASGGLVRAGSGTQASPYTLGINTGGVTSAMILDGTIATADIANNAVTVAKLPSGASATTFLRGDGTWQNPPNNTYTGSTSITLNGSSFERAALTGPVTAAANSNATTIANNAITTAMIADGAVTLSKIPTVANDSGLVLMSNGKNWVPARKNLWSYVLIGSTTMLASPPAITWTKIAEFSISASVLVYDQLNAISIPGITVMDVCTGGVPAGIVSVMWGSATVWVEPHWGLTPTYTLTIRCYRPSA